MGNPKITHFDGIADYGESRSIPVPCLSHDLEDDVIDASNKEETPTTKGLTNEKSASKEQITNTAACNPLHLIHPPSANKPTQSPKETRIKALSLRMPSARSAQFEITKFPALSFASECAFYDSLKPYLGAAGGKREAYLCMCVAFIACAILTSIPTSKAFIGGYEGDLCYIYVTFPMQCTLVCTLGFSFVSVFSNLGDICENLNSKETNVNNGRIQ
jgi:hypothetical protein